MKPLTSLSELKDELVQSLKSWLSHNQLLEDLNQSYELYYEENTQTLKMSLGFIPHPHLKASLQALQQSLKTQGVQFESVTEVKAHQTQGNTKPIKGIENIIAIASGKGGVGKSTVTTMLALSLAKAGARVGIVDADIYGPSIPRLFNSSKPPVVKDKKFIPPQIEGVSVMSIGFLVQKQTAMVWRGPMVMKAMEQLVLDTHWPPLDYLLLDLPPGTGDIQLTMAQKIPLSGALVVTTPQGLALDDVARALSMFAKLKIITLGLVENMSEITCPHCNGKFHPFTNPQHDAVKALTKDFSIERIASIPLSPILNQQLDGGVLCLDEQTLDIQLAYQNLAYLLSEKLANLPIEHRHKFPEIKIN